MKFLFLQNTPTRLAKRRRSDEVESIPTENDLKRNKSKFNEKEITDSIIGIFQLWIRLN